MSSSEAEGSVPVLGEDIPDGDWDVANADALTGTEEDDGDDTEPLYDSEQEEEVGVHLGAPRLIYHSTGSRWVLLELQTAENLHLINDVRREAGKTRTLS